MDKYLEKLSKIQYSALLLLSGVICFLLGKYQIEHIDKLKVVRLPETDYVIFGVGVLIILLSVAIQVYFIYAKIRESDIKNIEQDILIKKAEAEENITKAAEAISGRRFANLIYIYAEETKSIAMGFHEGHKVFLPPGGRLDVYEMPHESILNYVRDQIGLQLSYSDIVSNVPVESYIVADENGQKIGETDICPSPMWVQLEKHTQRPDHEDKTEVKEHFDFIFLCKLDKERELEGGVRRNVDWFSLDEVKGMLSNRDDKRTFPDVYAGFKAIRKYIENENDA